MDFLTWHYTRGLKIYLGRWFFSLGWIIHYFSLPLLVTSLFSPWKRLVDNTDIPGLNLGKIFEQLSFNLISRTIGAIVRLILILAGSLLLAAAFFLGLVGFAFWVVIPLLGLPYYYLHDSDQKKFLSEIASHILSRPSQAVKHLLDNRAGQFLLTHTNLQPEDLSSGNTTPEVLTTLVANQVTSYTQILDLFLLIPAWSKDHLHSKGLKPQDLQLAAMWWDIRNIESEDDAQKSLHFSRPGIGLELLFGYTPRLNQYVTDLGLPQPFSHRLVGRKDLVGRIERSLTSGKSTILIGSPGVGKKTVLLEFARRARSGQLGPQMVYKRVLEFDYTFLLSQSLDLNKKKALLSSLLAEASDAGNVILVIRDLHRLVHQDVEGLDFTDVFEKHLESQNLKMIAVSSPVEYERFLVNNSRLRKFLDPVTAEPPSRQEAQKILIQSASYWESQRHITILAQSLSAVMDGCDRYITETPYPEKALELLDHSVSLLEKSNRKILTPDDVNSVLSEQTGISIARLTEKERDLLKELETVLHRRLIGQDAAVTLIAKSLRSRVVGVKNESRPVGSFLFLGPTGVGKTQTAKTLAEVYFGSLTDILRFDMAEYSGSEGLPRLIGSVSQNQPGTLTSAIKNHPASLLLLDEIEKSSPQIYNLFLSLLDEGSVTDAFGKKIVCRHLFVIATSNAGSETIRQLLSKGVSGEDLQKQVVDHVQRMGIFSPEFLNRFDGVIVFEPLTPGQLTQIATLLLTELKTTLETQNNIHLRFDSSAVAKIASDGFEPQSGARPMRRIIDLEIGDLLARSILDERTKEGDTVTLSVDPGGNFTVN